MAEESLIIEKLKKLINLSSKSPFIYTISREVLFQSYKEPKPLFKSKEKRNEAGILLKSSLTRIESSLIKFHGSLNIDLRQNAQRLRSGIQFLVDEFDGETIHKEIVPILSCSAIQDIEEFIADTKGIPPEFCEPEPEDLNKLPLSHIWWNEKTNEDNTDISDEEKN